MKVKNGLSFTGHIRVEKFGAGADPQTCRPYDVVEGHNIGLTSGLNELWKLGTGQGGTAFTNTNAEIGIGDSSASAASGQTDLQAATNKTYKPMNAGYPTPPVSGQVQFQATFASTDANYAWNEFVIKNFSSGVCLNRSTNGGVGFGTKVAGTTWVVTATMTLS